MTGALGRAVAGLASGTTTSATLVAAALAAASTHQQLQAFVRLRTDAATAEAKAADATRAAGDTRPLLGVPLAVKDSHRIAGEPAPANGCDVSTAIETADDPWVASLRSAGAVVIGQTTMPPLALLPWGPARNPADMSRVAGGSSSGSAAAVAGGIVALATASDGGGSIRIPAALCGLFGFKPAQGLVPGDPHWHGLSTSGVLTETAADTALALDATGIPSAAGSWAEAERTPLERLRIGWTDTPSTPLGRPTHEVVEVLATALTTLAAHGHWVDPVALKLADAAPALSARLLRGAADDLRELTARVGPVTLPQPARLMTSVGARVPSAAVAAAIRRSLVIRERMRALPFDVLITPAVAAPPILHSAHLTHPSAVVDALRGASWTGVWNVAALPAASIPVGRTAAGLPLAVQVVDLRGDGSTLFGLARLLASPMTATAARD
jgi:amidase